MSQIWVAALLLGHSMTSARMAVDQCLPCHEPMTWAPLSDLQNCGPSCTCHHTGQCHRQLTVQFNMLVVCSVTTICPHVDRPESPFRDLLCQFPASCFGSTYPTMQRPHVQTLRMWCCPTNSPGRVALRPSTVVGFLSRRSMSCSCSRQRWPDSVMTEPPVRLFEGSPSVVVTELPTLPTLQPCVGNPSTRS